MNRYSCDSCSAQCTFEAMQMCQLDDCPTIALLNAGVIIDRRPTDIDPRFPSEFTYSTAQREAT